VHNVILILIFKICLTFQGPVSEVSQPSQLLCVSVGGTAQCTQPTVCLFHSSVVAKSSPKLRRVRADVPLLEQCAWYAGWDGVL